MAKARRRCHDDCPCPRCDAQNLPLTEDLIERMRRAARAGIVGAAQNVEHLEARQQERRERMARREAT